MAYIEHFVINKQSKRLLRMNGNSYDYWQGEKAGTIDMEIEVFADSNHNEIAKKVYNNVKDLNLKYIKVHV